ncbi:MAG TPA: hypothetical protein VNL14_20740 [Candidatus Acidoferrales bacterium]|nr:hypothetical protein [Candidatus Acidoferrales bacterium]
MGSAKTIYVDLDDVLCETARQCLRIIEREFGKGIVYEQLTTFDLGAACRLTPAEVAEFFRVVHRPDQLLQMEPVEGAISALREWTAAGYEIAIVTGRPPAAYEASVEWLLRHRVPHHSLTVVDKYGRFETTNTIGITLKELAARRFCWAVEDSLPVARYLAERGIPVALFDRPWNRAILNHSLIGRYTGWQEIAHALPKTFAAKGGSSE